MRFLCRWVGKLAGPIRNCSIASRADILIALVSEDRSGGTEDTVRKCLTLGKWVVAVKPNRRG